jgi:hypothetical protein
MHVDVRRFRDGDEPAVLDLFARSFPHDPRTREAFDWKYRRSPFGNAHISLAFDESQRLVGHYAGYPVPFVDRGEPLIAHHIGDTMTDLSVRHVGRGPTSVLGRTALHFYDNFCEGAVAFNYGFNVANIQKFSLRFLRSDRVEPVSYRVRGAPRAISRIRKWSRGFRLELVKNVTAEWDELFARVANDYEFLLRRDAQYVRWRYLDAPNAGYAVVAVRKWGKLAGWSTFKMRGVTLMWGDALFDRRWPEAAEVLLGHVSEVFKPHQIAGWFPPRPGWWDATLRQMEFESVREPQDLSVMCVPFTMPDATARMRKGFYYTMGDGDLF